MTECPICNKPKNDNGKGHLCFDQKEKYLCDQHKYDLQRTDMDRVIDVCREKAEIFKCTICEGLLTKPRTCYHCKAAFCTYCITNKLFEKDCCPNCFRQSPEIGKMPKNMLKAMRDIKVKCSVGGRGCDEEVSILDMAQHRINECKNMC